MESQSPLEKAIKEGGLSVDPVKHLHEMRSILR